MGLNQTACNVSDMGEDNLILGVFGLVSENNIIMVSLWQGISSMYHNNINSMGTINNHSIIKWLQQQDCNTSNQMLERLLDDMSLLFGMLVTGSKQS